MKTKWFMIWGSLLSLLLRCLAPGGPKQPVVEKEPQHDCARFAKIIDDLKAKKQIDQPVWQNLYEDASSPFFSSLLNDPYVGKGLICEGGPLAGGEEVWGDGITYKNDVSYSLRVYDTEARAKEVATLYAQGGKVIRSKNRVFFYYTDKRNEKNVSKVIVQAAADFLKSTE